MHVTRRQLSAVYAAVALLALVATWHQNVAYLGAGDPLTGTMQFWKETLVTPASVSITVDLFLFGLAIVVWMVAEARRLGMRFVWIYVVLGALIAISVTVPLFLAARERRLATLQPTADAVALGTGDLIGLGLFAFPTLLLSIWSLFH